MVKPGITGWAQINYPYGASIEDSRHKLEYDLYYAKNYTPFLDILILLQTIRVVLVAGGRALTMQQVLEQISVFGHGLAAAAFFAALAIWLYQRKTERNSDTDLAHQCAIAMTSFWALAVSVEGALSPMASFRRVIAQYRLAWPSCLPCCEPGRGGTNRGPLCIFTPALAADPVQPDHGRSDDSFVRRQPAADRHGDLHLARPANDIFGRCAGARAQSLLDFRSGNPLGHPSADGIIGRHLDL